MTKSKPSREVLDSPRLRRGSLEQESIHLVMFTGIIQSLGTVQTLRRQGDLLRLGISAPFSAEVKVGDSISVNGVCLTAVKIDKNIIHFDVMAETLKTASLAALKLKDKVNLERALKASDSLGGHFVTGHIDTVGTIRRKEVNAEQAVLEIAIDSRFMSGIVQKGSVAVDGISLTVAEKRRDSFVVGIIPHTLKVTTLGFKKPGDTVNIELDALGKYARLKSEETPFPHQSRITEEFLKEHGF